MNCSDALGRLDPYIDGELEMDENVEVVRHLETCAGCSSAFEGERLLFDEIRSQAAGPAAPATLRERISGDLARARAVSRPWPVRRALVPAAAAAILVGLFVLVFPPASLGPEALAQKAVSWHDAQVASVIPASTAPELASFFGSKGKKSCIHEKSVTTGMNYAYKAACVENGGPAGEITCWWTAACPVSGHRMSHANFPAPPGLEKTLTPGQKKTLEINGRVVILSTSKGFV